jgi:hypothetical protein
MLIQISEDMVLDIDSVLYIYKDSERYRVAIVFKKQFCEERNSDFFIECKDEIEANCLFVNIMAEILEQKRVNKIEN